MIKLILTRGAPASGKSSWALAWVAEDPENRAAVARDDIRSTLYGQRWGLSNDQENTVTRVQHDTIKTLLRNGKSVVVHDTNLRAATVKEFYKIADSMGAVGVEFQDFDTPVDVCIARDTQREHSVGADVIRNFASRYIKKGKLPPIPDRDKVISSGATPYQHTDGIPSAYLIDIDGTLARNVSRGWFDWDRVGEDELIHDVAQIVKDHHAAGNTIIVMSGRDASCFSVTWDWLVKHDIPFDHLFMRPEGDMRKDSIIKNELFDTYIRGKFNIIACYDDRNQVVDHYRAMGLTVCQVAPGDF